MCHALLTHGVQALTATLMHCTSLLADTSRLASFAMGAWGRPLQGSMLSTAFSCASNANHLATLILPELQCAVGIKLFAPLCSQ